LLLGGENKTKQIKSNQSKAKQSKAKKERKKEETKFKSGPKKQRCKEEDEENTKEKEDKRSGRGGWKTKPRSPSTEVPPSHIHGSHPWLVVLLLVVCPAAAVVAALPVPLPSGACWIQSSGLELPRMADE
jgi:hypothetical protein